MPKNKVFKISDGRRKYKWTDVNGKSHQLI